jgi:hypothetical protein
MLIPKLANEWDVIENEVILPLFATSSLRLHSTLIRELFQTLLPVNGEKVLSSLPRLSRMLIALHDVEVLGFLAREVSGLWSSKLTGAQQIATLIALEIVESPSATSQVVEIIQCRIRCHSVLSACIERATGFQATGLVVNGLPLLFQAGIDNEKEKTAEIVIKVLELANSVAPAEGARLVDLGRQLLDTYGYDFLRGQRTKFQKCLFDFFLNDTHGVRKTVRDIALASQSLFT